jgi:hypothetical protein
VSTARPESILVLKNFGRVHALLTETARNSAGYGLQKVNGAKRQAAWAMHWFVASYKSVIFAVF